MIKISVIVPCYKVEKYVSKLIESLQKQTLKDIEIILVDDGSPDNSGKICDEYAAKDERIRVIHKKNGGVSAARNDGMKQAHGEYIIFCDSDDWLPEDTLKNLYDEGKRTDADIVIGDVIQVWPTHEKYAMFYAKPFTTEDKTFIKKMIAADFHASYCPMPAPAGPAFGYGGPWNKIVKLSMLRDRNICFDVRVKGIFDDIIYTAYILANAKKIAYIQTPVYYYRIVENSITRTYKPNVLEINSAIFNSWEEYIDRYEEDSEWALPFAANVIRRLDDALRLYIANPNNRDGHTKRINVLRKLIKTEPYENAIKVVDAGRLIRRQQILVRLLRMGMTVVVYYLYHISNKRKK